MMLLLTATIRVIVRKEMVESHYATIQIWMYVFNVCVFHLGSQPRVLLCIFKLTIKEGNFRST